MNFDEIMEESKKGNEFFKRINQLGGFNRQLRIESYTEENFMAYESMYLLVNDSIDPLEKALNFIAQIRAQVYTANDSISSIIQGSYLTLYPYSWRLIRLAYIEWLNNFSIYMNKKIHLLNEEYGRQAKELVKIVNIEESTYGLYPPLPISFILVSLDKKSDKLIKSTGILSKYLQYLFSEEERVIKMLEEIS